jgi:hypothetical protein
MFHEHLVFRKLERFHIFGAFGLESRAWNSLNNHHLRSLPSVWLVFFLHRVVEMVRPAIGSLHIVETGSRLKEDGSCENPSLRENAKV